MRISLNTFLKVCQKNTSQLLICLKVTMFHHNSGKFLKSSLIMKQRCSLSRLLLLRTSLYLPTLQWIDLTTIRIDNTVLLSTWESKLNNQLPAIKHHLLPLKNHNKKLHLHKISIPWKIAPKIIYPNPKIKWTCSLHYPQPFLLSSWLWTRLWTENGEEPCQKKKNSYCSGKSNVWSGSTITTKECHGLRNIL